MQQHEGFTNELINETSPYLLEHAHNPVNWYPWGEKALEKAKLENKPLIISIGYAACHWCHVMEKESFSDTSVARLMNENFVCIKVDREERPDVDQVYMDACQMVTGSGGWPLNAFALPDGKPFYAGTYFPKKQWVQLLEQLDRAYREEYEKVFQQAENITQGIRRMDLMNLPKEDSTDLDPDSFDKLFSQWESNLDFDLGGFNRAPKFPLPSAWNFLLEFNYFSRDEKSFEAVRLTLDEMAKGGIYDQIGGGFARYSTDAYWRVPHFEKMLYDNAQLVSLYSKAYRSKNDPEYRFIIESTLDFIARELTDPNGGFYSSLNADSEGEEGKYYVWTYGELKEALGDEDLTLIEKHYNITERGNWEHGKNILYRTSTLNELESDQQGPSLDRLLKINRSLLEIREKRIRPSTDDKILTSWNAMMISGYLDAYLALGKQEYLEIAIRESNFLKEHVLTERKRLFHNYKNGKASIYGFLEDYAFLIKAYIDLYQITFDQQWLDLSNELTRVAIEEFLDDSSGLFFFTARSGEQLVARKIEIPDNVIPSANSVMANNLFILGHLYFDEEYLKMSKKMLTLQIPSIQQGGAYFSNWASLWGKFIKNYYEVAITGKDATKNLLEIRSAYLPNAVFLGGMAESLPLLESKLVEGQTTIYVCKGRVCDLPTTEVKKALEQIKK